MRRGKADLTFTHIQFHCNASYLGWRETFVALGNGCTRAHAQALWDSAPKEEELPRVTASLGQDGLCIRSLNPKDNPRERKYALEGISYCCAEGGVHGRVFTWISRNSERERFECHALLCSSKEKASMLAANLSLAFTHAYQDIKANRSRQERLAKFRQSGRSDHAVNGSSSDNGTHSQMGQDRSTIGPLTRNDQLEQESYMQRLRPLSSTVMNALSVPSSSRERYTKQLPDQRKTASLDSHMTYQSLGGSTISSGADSLPGFYKMKLSTTDYKGLSSTLERNKQENNTHGYSSRR